MDTCRIDSHDIVSQVEAARQQHETTRWMRALQAAAAKLEIGFATALPAQDLSWLPRKELARALYEQMLQSTPLMPEAMRSRILAETVDDGSAQTYLEMWMSLLAEVGLQPVQLGDVSKAA